MAFKKRYILAEDAEKRVVSLFRKERNDAANIFNTAIDACQSIILDMYDNAPDVVEVVRCKDCKCWDRDDEYCVDFLTQDKNGFCSWWEKREDECGKAQ